ncbi:MAG: hypothetical protein GY827_09310 [Cytophagales bacterium]|nr:hypothetical protein [Cytophagales bacterium]
MKRNLICTIGLIFSILLLTNEAYAQRSHRHKAFPKRNHYQSWGGALNAMNYVGDLDPASNLVSPSLRFTRWNLGAVYTYRFHPRMSYRGAFSYGRIQGSDRESASSVVTEDVGRYERNLSFRNDIFELKGDVMIDLFANRKGLKRRVTFTPYGFAGVAFYYHAPKAEYNGEWVDLQPLGTEGQNISNQEGLEVGKSYSKFRISIPFGVGLRYKIHQYFDLSFEIGWRATFFDYLDDVGGTNFIANTTDGQFDKSLLGDPNSLVVAMHDRSIEVSETLLERDGYTYSPVFAGGTNAGPRGDKGSDWYIVTGFHLYYILHPKVICPKYR